jgi:hypothetical protein
MEQKAPSVIWLSQVLSTHCVPNRVQGTYRPLPGASCHLWKDPCHTSTCPLHRSTLTPVAAKVVHAQVAQWGLESQPVRPKPNCSPQLCLTPLPGTVGTEERWAV